MKKNERSGGISRLILRVAFSVALLSIVGARAFAQAHPVTLDKNADSAKCLECHEDKSKGKAVHSAIAMGCLSCHEIRTNRDVTHIKLIANTPAKLCATCHSDKDAGQIKGHIHPPAVRDCLKCHDPHSSDNKNQLLKPMTGGKGENLCLQCHNTGVNVPAKGSRHAALDMGCDTCHITHKTGEVGKAEFDFHLTKAAPALCIDCHDPKDAALAKAHQNQPFEKADCLSCHDPHQSAAPKLLAKFTHPPFADKQCDVCHAPAKDGKVVLTQPDAKTLCVTCHDDKAKLIETAKVQHPGAAGECTDCHSPHASRQPGLPKTNAVDICLSCHSDIADLAKKPYHHQPAFTQGCATCHQPHGGENEHLLRAKTTNALCLECHGPDREPKMLEAQHLLTIFNGSVQLPDDYFVKNKVVVLPLKYGMGHPVAGHPVSDLMDPTTPGKVTTPMNCLTCHQPHASAQPDLLVKDQANNMAFCSSCHKDLKRQ
ncbi:MAG TPA: cytochrome c3 family protein [Candidatus Sulfotelmatobacter sp.]|nr:cytochrome c3 family protein [Candidatus Sulfotelmatobacter sp.]